MKSDDQHEIAVRESLCSEPLRCNQCYNYHNFFNLQQLHKYYRFLTVIFNYLLMNLLKMRKKADDYFLK